MPSPQRPERKRSVRKRRLSWGALLAAALMLGVWVLFFDSHSVRKRVRFRQQHTQLTTENDSLRRQIEALEAKLEDAPSDSTIERIAREEYGMRRPDEVVYRVE